MSQDNIRSAIDQCKRWVQAVSQESGDWKKKYDPIMKQGDFISLLLFF
jgi:hypothetical protein